MKEEEWYGMTCIIMLHRWRLCLITVAHGAPRRATRDK